MMGRETTLERVKAAIEKAEWLKYLIIKSGLYDVSVFWTKVVHSTPGWLREGLF